MGVSCAVPPSSLKVALPPPCRNMTSTGTFTTLSLRQSSGNRKTLAYRETFRWEVVVAPQTYLLVVTVVLIAAAASALWVRRNIAEDPLDAADVLGLVGLGDRLDHFPGQSQPNRPRMSSATIRL
jgi:hypothetical protein